MDVRDYQEWVREFDQDRGWDLCPGTDTLAHLFEELGEVSRCILALEGYKTVSEPEQAKMRENLGTELADAATFLVKLAYTYDLDLAEYLVHNQAKCRARYGAGTGGYETAEYLNRRAVSANAMLSEYHRRFEKKE